MRLRWGFAALIIILCVGVVAAQDDNCPEIVQTAVSAASEACSGLGRNQACYGNIQLDAVPQAGVADLQFSQPGDLVNISDVQSLTLSPLDRQENRWGVALMKIQANLPDTLPGQNVTFVLFGDVEIANAVVPTNTEAVTLPATVSSMTPIIESFTETTNVPQMLSQGQTLTADGLDSSGQYLHVILEDGTAGWVPLVMVQVDGDVSALASLDLLSAVTSSSATPSLNPMQAFYFKSGFDDAPCESAPDSGILIQTPQGGQQITLTMNGVEVQLGSTAYIQTSDELTFNLVEGESEVTSDGVTRVVPAGTRVRIPLAEEEGQLVASGPPSEVEPYDADAFAALPLALLDEAVTVAPPLTAEQIAGLGSATAGSDITPVSGDWTYTNGTPTTTDSCPPGVAGAMASATGLQQDTSLHVPDGSTLIEVFSSANALPGMELSNPEPGLYVMELTQGGPAVRWELRVTSATHIDGQSIITIEGGCIITVPFQMDANS